jgi:flagella basal body P-ring formation protein FlgA
VLAPDAEKGRTLAAIDLLPAPPAGEKRFVRVREIQDLLALRGVNLAEHRFSGAPQVTLIGAAEAPRAAAPARTSAAVVKKANQSVREAIVRHLQTQTSTSGDWTVKVDLDDDQAHAIAAATGALAIAGGSAPWTGAQQFVVSSSSLDGAVRVPLAAQISLPPSVVVAVHSLSRGSIVRPHDVRLQPGKATEGAVHVYQTLDEVIGKEAIRSISEGQILDEQFVRPSILVRRGEVVTVYARAAGIQVKTNARAREDGSHGDLVTLESLGDRKAFVARVSGPQEAEIYAHAIAPAPAEAASLAPELGVRPARAQAAIAPATGKVRTTEFSRPPR